MSLPSPLAIGGIAPAALAGGATLHAAIATGGTHAAAATLGCLDICRQEADPTGVADSAPGFSAAVAANDPHAICLAAAERPHP